MTKRTSRAKRYLRSRERSSRRGRKTRYSYRKPRRAKTTSSNFRRKKAMAKYHWRSPLVSTRKSIYKKCGAKCFLKPNTLGFPICKTNCKVNQAGLHAAYVRARQWKYNDIANKAKKMLKSRGRRSSRK